MIEYLSRANGAKTGLHIRLITNVIENYTFTNQRRVMLGSMCYALFL
jgi:hypothetical protein